MTAKRKPMYKRVSISIAGATMTVSQSAVNLSEALNQELEYGKRSERIIAQVNITLEPSYDV
jgi:hypothetical protein